MHSEPGPPDPDLTVAAGDSTEPLGELAATLVTPEPDDAALEIDDLSPPPPPEAALSPGFVARWRFRFRYRVAPSRAGTLTCSVVGFVAVVAVLAFVFGEMRPALLFGRGADIGGDNGGHIAAPYFLIHYLLPHGRLTGWDPWWFDGFPLYVFYFPLPALLVAIGTVVLPYSVAFKLVTALGTLTLPFVAYLFGRLAGFRRPVPVLMAVAMAPFLFNTSYTIDGGNIASTMAGEFSFSLAVSTGLAFLGVVAYSLRTGKLRWLAALLFAITCVCHVIPALAFGATALLMAVCTLKPSRWRPGARIIVPIGLVGALLAAWWLVPFAADLQYSSSMNYTPVGGPSWFAQNFLPDGYLFMLVPAALGGLVAIAARNRVAFVLTLSAALSALAFHWLPSGLVYNARWLPFWFLYVSLLAAYGIGETIRALARFVAPATVVSVATVLFTLGGLVGAVFTGGLEGNGFLGAAVPPGHTQVSGWIVWNYSGLQAKSGYPYFRDMVRLLDRAGKRYGCGRLQYEYLSETTNPFGSTEEMMSIPMWTNGCMETTDGIYFESSTTTPFHFLDVSEVSQNGESPDPIAGLDYPGFNLADGIRHLQLMGVRYFLAMSPPVEAAASVDRALVRIGSAPSFPGPYNNEPVAHPEVVLYLIKHAPLVVGLSHLPTVEPTTKNEWLDVNLRWYEDERYWPELLARSGPANWPRARAGTLVSPARAVPVPHTTVSHVVVGTSTVSFDVSRLHTPVLVKVPYFPNWTASGATGPYEVSPNLMVVVPTSHHVTVTYGTSPADWAGKASSLVGVVGLGALLTARPATPAMDGPTYPLLPAPAGSGAPGAVGELDATDDEDDDEDDDEGREDSDQAAGDSGPEPPDSRPEAGADPAAFGATPAAGEETVEGTDRSQTPELSIVLPAHNEETLLGTAVRALWSGLREQGRTFELLIIENGSTDATAQIGEELARELDGVYAASLPVADYGDALRAGFLVSRGDVVVNFDVDYVDLAFLDSAVGTIERGEAAIVLASKRAPGSEDHRPFLRRVLTAGFTSSMRVLLDLPVSDAHGMKAMDRQAVLPAVLASQLGGALFDVEVVLRAARTGLGVAEVPAEVRELRPARTGVAGRALTSLTGLLRLRWIVGPARPA